MKKCVIYSEDEYKSICALLLRVHDAVKPLPCDYNKGEILRYLNEAIDALSQEDAENET